MTDLNRVDSSNIDAVTSAGVAAPANHLGAPSTFGVTLLSGTVYYFPIGAPKAPVPAEAPLFSVQLRGAAALIVTAATVEDTDFPATTSPGDGRGAVDVTDFDQTAGSWVPENPSTAIVGVVGTGWTSTAATVAAAGTGAGAAIWHIGNTGSRRWRLRVAVGATGGLARVAVHGKGGVT